jgi:hypothetical protein
MEIHVGTGYGTLTQAGAYIGGPRRAWARTKMESTDLEFEFEFHQIKAGPLCMKIPTAAVLPLHPTALLISRHRHTN